MATPRGSPYHVTMGTAARALDISPRGRRARRQRSADRDQHGLRKLGAGLRRLGWPEPSIAQLLDVARIVTFPHGQTIYADGSPAIRLFWLLDGVVKLFVPGPDGRRVLVALAKPGALLGSTLVIGERRMEMAVTLTDVRAAAFERDAFQAVTRSLPAELLQAMTGRTLEVLSRSFLRTVRLLTLDLRGKLALSLAELADGFGVADAEGRLLKVQLTHGDLAELAGISRARVTKVLREFTECGLVRRRGRSLVVNSRALRELMNRRAP